MPDVEVPMPAPDSALRSVIKTRTLADGSQEFSAVEQYVAIDGEWIDVHELIDVWRRCHSTEAEQS